MNLTRERFDEIFEETEAKWEGDNAYQGLQILSKYTDNLIHGAGHDIIYGEDVDKLLESGLTEEDTIALSKLNWMIDSDNDCLACFV